MILRTLQTSKYPPNKYILLKYTIGHYYIPEKYINENDHSEVNYEKYRGLVSMDKTSIKQVILEQREIFDKKLKIVKRDIPENLLKFRIFSVI